MRSIILLCLTALLGGCLAAPPAGPSLSAESLENSRYSSRYHPEGRVHLAEGVYDNPLRRLRVSLAGPVAYGDLDGDGLQDAVAILVTETGGSGSFVELAAILNDGGRPNHVSSVFLGDRVKVRTLSVRKGTVTVDMLTQGPYEPMCCPTEEVTPIFRFDGGELVKVEGK
ncbi:MAG: hypothetical protein C0617_16505 [Desulfuromonas sp.]|uniref:hypothetical protein n=1 Tax=Desulfuromonas sp. TaxID=892 RepID=UPI000CC678D9|nr:hypothetical protein [Desulfuromonas sp.]PLX81689.1 MAG: hypothetical protein C0617_16505 [Desulfuromonas sp.]